MIILRQNHYSKADLNKLGLETDKDIREAVKGTKAEKKVDEILDRSTREMKKAAQKEYAAISDSGEVTMKTRDALEKARELGYTKKAAVKAAKRFLDKSRDDMNDWNKGVKKAKERLTTRPRMGFIKDRIKDFEEVSERAKDSRIGFRPDWTEIKGSSVRIGFKKFSKTSNPGVMTIEDIFSIIRRGTVATGKVESGNFKVGDKVEISDGKNKIQTSIKGLEIWRKTVDEVSEGDSVGILFPFPEISKNDIKRGMVIKVVSPDQKQFSKQDREVVPADIVKKVKDGGGVIQKDHNGDWRIVSMKTNPPTFWDAHYDSKALASKALGGYFANKR